MGIKPLNCCCFFYAVQWWFERIGVICIKLLEICSAYQPVHDMNTLKRLWLVPNCSATLKEEADDGGLIQAFRPLNGVRWLVSVSRVRPFDGPNSMIKSSNTNKQFRFAHQSKNRLKGRFANISDWCSRTLLFTPTLPWSAQKNMEEHTVIRKNFRSSLRIPTSWVCYDHVSKFLHGLPYCGYAMKRRY